MPIAGPPAPPPPPRLMPAIMYWDSMFSLKSPRAILPRLILRACDHHSTVLVRGACGRWESNCQLYASAPHDTLGRYSPCNCSTLEPEESSAVFKLSPA